MREERLFDQREGKCRTLESLETGAPRITMHQEPFLVRTLNMHGRFSKREGG